MLHTNSNKKIAPQRYEIQNTRQNRLVLNKKNGSQFAKNRTPYIYIYKVYRIKRKGPDFSEPPRKNLFASSPRAASRRTPPYLVPAVGDANIRTITILPKKIPRKNSPGTKKHI